MVHDTILEELENVFDDPISNNQNNFKNTTKIHINTRQFVLKPQEPENKSKNTLNRNKTSTILNHF
jgi:hypothetical protein